MQRHCSYSRLASASVIGMALCLSAALLPACQGCHRQAPAAGQVIAAPAANSVARAVTPAPPAPTAPEVRARLAAAAQAAPTDPQPALELALFDLKLNDLQTAEQELIACCQKFPRYARAPYFLGMFYLMNGRQSSALSPLRTAAALDPGDAVTLANAGQACLENQLEPEARRYLEAALRCDPEMSAPYLGLARLDDHVGTADKALAELRRYLALSPTPG